MMNVSCWNRILDQGLGKNMSWDQSVTQWDVSWGRKSRFMLWEYCDSFIHWSLYAHPPAQLAVQSLETDDTILKELFVNCVLWCRKFANKMKNLVSCHIILCCHIESVRQISFCIYLFQYLKSRGNTWGQTAGIRSQAS